MPPLDRAQWAAALDGDRVSLMRCARSDAGGDIAQGQRVAAALALLAGDLGVEGPAVERWRRRLRRVAVQGLMLEQALAATGRALGEAGLRWAPIKGLDLATRVYPRPEERPSSDVDLLVPSGDLDRAVEVLRAAGWTPLAGGPRAARYLREEGYAWQARSPTGVLVEMHYRLWGSVAAGTGDAMITAAAPDPDLGPGGHRLDLADAYVLAAHHLWLDAPPRRLGAVRDLVMLSRAAGPGRDVAGEVVARAERFDLQLPVALAARWSSALWPGGRCADIDRRLSTRLRSVEKLWRRRQAVPEAASLTGLTLARQLARRRTRHSALRLAWRRIWAHAGIVEAAFDGDRRAFYRQRLLYQLAAWGLRRP